MDRETTAAIIMMLAVWGFMLYLILKRIIRNANKRKQKYTTKLADSIEKCHYIKRQIDACEELLLAIRMSDEHHQRNIQLTWTTETELIKNADIWVDGSSQTTEQLRALAESKVEELITSLFIELDRISEMRHNNVIITTALRPLGDRGSGR